MSTTTPSRAARRAAVVERVIEALERYDENNTTVTVGRSTVIAACYPELTRVAAGAVLDELGVTERKKTGGGTYLTGALTLADGFTFAVSIRYAPEIHRCPQCDREH